ncbi:hypothetical protein CRUP_016185 [Coryphaenoides rupestris]|nr:hypothetical protein CRUP_016185 [Coryphaenoides rupestris]
MPGATGVTAEGSCQALCKTLISQNGLQRETTDISQSCFLNAIVQCLSHTPSLRDYCLLKLYRQEKSSKEEPKLMEAFSQVLAGLWDVDGESTVVNPRQFYSTFKETVPYFSGYSQQDAQEFLRFLLDRLHNEINRHACVRRTGKEPLRSSLHCSVCSHYSNTFDVFCDLSLPMPKRGSTGGVALRECLDLFSQEERLDEDNAPMCERCNRRTRSTKRLSIQRFPQVIVIRPVLYDLYAVCNHSGTVNMGHYTACCREDTGWCFYNDSR